MVNEELIARREAIARDLTAALAAREVDKFQLIAFMDRHEIIAALQSRPAPTEVRAREVLAETLDEVSEYQARVLRNGKDPIITSHSAIRAMLRFATETQSVAGGGQCPVCGATCWGHHDDPRLTPTTGERDHVVDVTDMITTPERAKALEDAKIRRAIRAFVAEQDDSDADISPLQYILNREDLLAAAIAGALAASPPEVVEGES